MKHKKCPFCGGVAYCGEYEENYIDVYDIICTKCGATFDHHKSEEEAWKQWDTRYQDDKITKLVGVVALTIKFFKSVNNEFTSEQKETINILEDLIKEV